MRLSPLKKNRSAHNLLLRHVAGPTPSTILGQITYGQELWFVISIELLFSTARVRPAILRFTTFHHRADPCNLFSRLLQRAPLESMLHAGHVPPLFRARRLLGGF